MEIVFRFDPALGNLPVPQTAAEAKAELEDGNRLFATLLAGGPDHRHVLPFDPSDFGLADESGAAPKQEPFAAVLGCADARVPTEMVFEQGANDLFVVRVAGNVVGDECLGSLSYASHHFPSLKLIAVLGHMHCGAVTAAVDAYLQPGKYLPLATNFPLQSIVNRILPSARGAALALRRIHGSTVSQMPGYRTALIETAVVMNAAWSAYALWHELTERDHTGMDVVFGVYDLVSRLVRLPVEEDASGRTDVGLQPSPKSEAEFDALGDRIAGGAYVNKVLRG